MIAPDLYFEFTQEAIDATDSLLLKAKQCIETRIRLDAEQAERVAESERQAKVKIEQDRIAAEQAEAQAKIDKANRKIEAEKAAIAEAKRAEQVRKDRAEFEHKAKINAEKKAKEDAEFKRLEKIRVEHEVAEEIERQKAMLPDKEKLMGFGQYIAEGITYPTVESDEGKEILKDAKRDLVKFGISLYELAQKL